MAQQVVTWCDRHMARDETVPGRPVTLSIDGTRPMAIDLCEPCAKELLEPIESLLADVGRAVELPRAKRGPGRPSMSGLPASDVVVACPLCAEEKRTTTMLRASMRSHMQSEHDTTLAAVEAKRGEALDGTPLPFSCTVCSPAERFGTPQGLGAHQRARHGIVGASAKPASA